MTNTKVSYVNNLASVPNNCDMVGRYGADAMWRLESNERGCENEPTLLVLHRTSAAAPSA